jgi:hypothetical protein
MFDNHQVVEIYTNGDYALKYVINLKNFSLIFDVFLQLIKVV